jgi:hypothetical protein
MLTETGRGVNAAVEGYTMFLGRNSRCQYKHKKDFKARVGNPT